MKQAGLRYTLHPVERASKQRRVCHQDERTGQKGGQKEDSCDDHTAHTESVP